MVGGPWGGDEDMDKFIKLTHATGGSLYVKPNSIECIRPTGGNVPESKTAISVGGTHIYVQESTDEIINLINES